MRIRILVISAFWILVSFHSASQVRWDGEGGDGLWENALNWENNIVPATTNNVLLDNSFVDGDYTVTLPSGTINTTVSSLIINPDAAAIRLIIPASNTANPALSITGTGDALVLNNGAVLQNSSGLTGAGAGLFITNTFRINNGGRYIHNTASGNSSVVSHLSADAGTETGIFEYDVPGSGNYEIAAAGETYGTLILSATASGNSNYTISSGSVPVSARGDFRVNGNAHISNFSPVNIIINGNLQMQSGSSADLSAGSDSPVLAVKGDFTNRGIITASGAGNPVIELNGTGIHSLSVPGTGAFSGDNLDFVINTPGTIRMTTTVNLPHDLFVQAGTIDISDAAANYSLGIKGDLQIQGTITESGTGAPRVILNGTANQNISVTGSGSITGNQLNFVLNNPAGATLLSDLVLPYYYTITSGNLTLGNFSLTTLFVSQSAPVLTNHIITNGTGFLIIPNVGSTLTTFPVGTDATSVNTLEISNGGGLTYSVRVNTGITPNISNPLIAINRTWTINTSGVPPAAVSVTFYYFTGQGKTGFDYSARIDVGQFASSAWNLIRNNEVPTKNVDEYRIVTLINSFNTPFIIGNHGAILPVDFFIACKALKSNERGIVSWEIENSENVSLFEVEKSVDNSPFKSIASVSPENNKMEYRFDDKTLETGSNFYRVKAILAGGKIKYSNTVAIIHKSRQVLITSIAPNPAQGTTRVVISSPVKSSMQMTMYDMQGRLVKQWQQSLSDGTNTISLRMGDLRSGIYFLSGTDGDIKTNLVKIVRQ